MEEDKVLIKRVTKFGKHEFDIFDSENNSILISTSIYEFVLDQHEDSWTLFEIQTEEELDLIISKLESLRTVFTKNKSK